MIRRVRLFLARLFLRTVGRWSDGLRICMDDGLTSGKMLDYVYRNRPSGFTFVGKAIDRAFLNAAGWQAIRIRRRNLERLMRESITELRAAGRRIRIVDVASGPASYVFSVLDQVGANGVEVLCRDLDEDCVRRGADEARRRGLDGVRFERGDAMDREALLAITPRPSVAVASGFYDWMTDDEMVRTSMRLLHEMLAPEGILIVTNQSGNPHLAVVSKIFVDFRKAPLVMKTRPASEIEGWLREAGFEVQQTLSDRDGRYTVTRARAAVVR